MNVAVILNKLFHRATFIDPHFHASPDTRPRRAGALEAAREYAACGGAVWFKRHDGSTVRTAGRVRRLGFPAGASIVLAESTVENWSEMVRAELACPEAHWCGGSHLRTIVYFPTSQGPDHFRSNSVVSRVIDTLLDTILVHDAVLATGHLRRDDVFWLVDRALQHGLPNILLTHALHPMIGMDLPDIEKLASHEAVFVEHTALSIFLGRVAAPEHWASLTSIPRLIYSSDFGQPTSPTVAEWQMEAARQFDSMGLSESRIRDITLRNAQTMLLRTSDMGSGSDLL